MPYFWYGYPSYTGLHLTVGLAQNGVLFGSDTVSFFAESNITLSDNEVKMITGMIKTIFRGMHFRAPNCFAVSFPRLLMQSHRRLRVEHHNRRAQGQQP